MTAAAVADLLADLIAPAANDSARSLAANAAKTANRKHPCGFAADFDSAKALRTSANLAAAATEAGRYSQTFAADSQPRNRAESEHRRRSSQNSQDSQWAAGGNTPPAANHPDDLAEREAFEERVAILEFDAGLPRAEAERIAAGHGEIPARAQAPRSQTPAQDRQYRLSQAEGDAAHLEAWDDAACARYAARVAHCLRLGFSGGDADDLAERLHLLDVQAEGRHLSLDCAHLAGHASAGWRCRSPRAAQVAPDLPRELVTLAQRCPGFREQTS